MNLQITVELLNRPGDMVARYGGDEFMILIPGINAEGAAEMAEAMRVCIVLIGVAD